MFKHADIWSAIDALAREHGLTASALARKAGLDPTTFNKSKRVTRDGKLRWPSTESVAKILDATGASLAHFVSHIASGHDGDGHGPGSGHHGTPTIPLAPFFHAADHGLFDGSGHPTGGNWDKIPFPGGTDPHAYGLEVSGSSMEPLFRDGDVIVVSPTASLRRGDRVVVKTTEGDLMVRQLVRRTARHIDLAPLNPFHPAISLAARDLAWMARIVWASQ